MDRNKYREEYVERKIEKIVLRWAMFARRARDRAGVELLDVAAGKPDDLLCGHIFINDDFLNVTLVAVGYPEFTDDDGVEYWKPHQFRLITHAEPGVVARVVEQETPWPPLRRR